MDPGKEAAVRRSVKWVAISFVPLFAGPAWLLFAQGHWAGSRGVFLGMSGLMIGLAADSALLLPFFRAINSTRRVLGMTNVRYTVVSFWLAIGIAAVLLVAAVVVP
jgi:hypothetical protein